MCFPLVIERWGYQMITGKRMHVYDGCAQYLNSPWCCALIKKVTPKAGIIAGIRDPKSQNASWWKFEAAAQKWGESLGLPPSVPGFRIKYPPRNLEEALKLSDSKEIKSLFERALKLRGPFLPSWAVPTPNGQLSGLTQMTRYSHNIHRFVDAFGPKRVIVSPVSKLSENPGILLDRISRLLDGDSPETPNVSDGSREISKESVFTRQDTRIEAKKLNATSSAKPLELTLSPAMEKAVNTSKRREVEELRKLFSKIQHPEANVPSWMEQ
eukprot:CAMPEP_0170174996 /NCGR_PEP_ID=MMETSP0040_2-20121228/8158_1 /TAXON_ID=641309 /ORGANISM="Lotharella oceanica, Strain CCMP622" /LENGTH=268 /DNA_ID=CAMNT_0010416841 /DNA_START=355 /DNA_END=1161 /DNA_ORIENTATION=-